MKLLKIIRAIKRKIKSKVYGLFWLHTKGKLKLLGRVNVDNSNVYLGKNVTLYDNVSFLGEGKITIGDNVVIGNNSIIFSVGSITIGDNTSIAANNYIIDCDHGVEINKLINEQPLIIDPVFIGKDVWLGAGVTILKGANVADGCVIGANSTVTKEIKEKNAIYVGSPVKLLKKRK